MKKQKGWIIIGLKRNGDYVGYIENSFSMGRSLERVLVFRPNPLSEKEHPNKSAVDNARSHLAKLQALDDHTEWWLYRVGSCTCPVKIDWGSLYEEYRGSTRVSNFNWRNLKFSRK